MPIAIPDRSFECTCARVALKRGAQTRRPHVAVARGAVARGGASASLGFRVYDGIPGAGGTLVATVAAGSTGGNDRVRDATGATYADTTAFAAASDAGGLPIEVTITTGILVIAPSATASTSFPIAISVYKKP